MPQDEEQPQDRAKALREAAARASEAFDDDLEIADVDPLADTVADEFVVDEEPRKGDGQAFDRLFGHEIVSLDEIDPEAGQLSVAQRVRLARVAARTPGGRLVTATPPLFVGIALGIFAVVHQTTPLIVAAGIVTPITLLWWILCYRSWLGHKRYGYRLLESLGEDVSDYSASEKYRPPKVRRSSRRR